MPDPTPPQSPPPSARTEAREKARAGRVRRRERRKTLFDLVVSGFSYDDIAAKAQVSVATVRRQVDRVLAERAPDPADRYVALQIERLQKALRVVDHAIEDGDYGAVPALATLMGKFDRYHGLAAALSGAGAEPIALASAAPPVALPGAAAPALQNLAPNALESQER